MLTLFERFLITITRVFPTGTGTGKARSRREFLGSTLRVGVGLATLQFAALVRPEGAMGASGVLTCDPLGPGPCGGCYGCECCESNVFLECEPETGACEDPNKPCWSVGEVGTCCDYCCPEGFCCDYQSFE